MSETKTTLLISGTEQDKLQSCTLARDFISSGVTSQKAPRSLGLLAGIALSMVAPSTTACFDPWFNDRSKHASSVYGLFPSRKFRYVSLAEARRIALDILLNADACRLEAADREAARGFSWSEFS